MTLDRKRENYLSQFPSLANYRQHHTLLPAIQAIDADWLTRLLQPVYPGLLVEAMTINEVIGGRTTRIRAQLVLNVAGRRAGEIGRASCRERVCQYVSIWVVAG